MKKQIWFSCLMIGALAFGCATDGKKATPLRRPGVIKVTGFGHQLAAARKTAIPLGVTIVQGPRPSDVPLPAPPLPPGAENLTLAPDGLVTQPRCFKNEYLHGDPDISRTCWIDFETGRSYSVDTSSNLVQWFSYLTFAYNETNPASFVMINIEVGPGPPINNLPKPGGFVRIHSIP